MEVSNQIQFIFSTDDINEEISTFLNTIITNSSFSTIYIVSESDLIKKTLNEKYQNTKILFPTEIDEEIIKTVIVTSNLENISNELLLFYKKGWAVIDESNLKNLNLTDVLAGFLLEESPEFFAKVFEKEVIVTDPTNIHLSLGCTINPRAIMLSTKVNEKGGSIKIGRASHVGADALFNLAGANFTMGNFCMISANVSIHGARHSITHPSSFNITKGPFKWFGALYDSVGDIVVGNDVWIGEGTTILPGITIGDGAVVGAASVVTKSIEPYSIYAGNPAKFIRKRFSEEKIELLQKVQWWNWSYEKIKKNNSFFEMDIDKISLEELKKILNEMGD